MKRIVMGIFLLGAMAFGQDPQTNYPKTFYPILDEYIKEGFDRNYRAHTRTLGKIEYVYFMEVSEVKDEEVFTRIWGNNHTYKIYRWFSYPLNERRYVIAFNRIWSNNYYVLRRMVFKALGTIRGLKECHKDCKHVMSGRDLFDPVLVFYDAVPEEWEKELDLFYLELEKIKTGPYN